MEGARPVTSSEALKTEPSPVTAAHPRVSVCIPAYQAARYLQAALDSILAQDYPDFEVVVVDNNSSDGTREILDAIKDDRLRVVRNATTLPVMDNFNYAVAQSRGKFVKVFCADDLLEPSCIAQQVAVFESNPGVALVASPTDFIDDNGELIVAARGLGGIVGQLPAEHVIKRLVRSGGNPIGAPLAAMFRRDDFDRSGGFRAELEFLADLDLWSRLLQFGDFVGLPMTLGSFRIRSESVSGLTSARVQLAQHIEFDRQIGGDPRWNISVADRILGRFGCYENIGRRALLFGYNACRTSRRSRKPVASPLLPVDSPAPAETLSTVICGYTTRRWEELCQAVESALAQDFTIMDLILVIDYCPELYQLASDRFRTEERVTVLQNVHERGLSGARNTGVDAARGDVIAFLDDDAVAEPGWARSLMHHYLDSRVAGVGGYASPVWPDGRPAWMPREFDWVVGCSYAGQPTELAPVRNPLGCNMSLRRSVFDAVGGFRSEVGRVGSHPVGGEETELCIRIGASQPFSQILFDPESRVQHHVSSDRATLRYFVRRCYHEGMSKAVVAELADAPKALSSERTYTLNTLPRGVLRECRSMHRDGFTRAGVMLVGLAVTTAGYLNAKARRRLLIGAT